MNYQQESKSSSSSSNDLIGATELQQKPQIYRVPDSLRRTCSEQEFKPKVVSLGPYHRDQHHLKSMEEQKITAAKLFTSDKIEDFRKKARSVVQEARKWYGEEDCIIERISDEDFEHMIFLDGCFVLHIINFMVNGGKLGIKMRLLPLVVEDMFLLENQLPFIVLKALISLKDGMKLESLMDQFLLIMTESQDVPLALLFNRVMVCPWTVKQIFIMGLRQRIERRNRVKYFWERGTQGHLLQLLRLELLNYSYDENGDTLPSFWHPPRTVTELKAAGIEFKKSGTNSVNLVHFKRGILFGSLYLPSMTHLSKRRLLNLIAYELCPGGPSSYEITSYFCFLDGLIDRGEDVKELRSKNLLPKGLGTDREAARFFNLVGRELDPDPFAYNTVLKDIKAHFNTKWRADSVSLYYKYLSSPWSIISFIAATVILILTGAQTYFTVFPPYNSNNGP